MSFSMPPPDDSMLQPAPALGGMMGEWDPMAEQIEPIDPAMMPELAEEPAPEEPEPRPIDWRVKKYWADEEQRRKLGRWLKDEIDRYYRQVQWRLDNITVWRDDYEMMPAETDAPWENSATIRADFTRYVVDAIAARLNAQLVQGEPVLLAEPEDEEALEAAPDIEEAMAGRLEQSGWSAKARALHKDLGLTGNAFWRTEFVREVKRVPVLDVPIDEGEFFALILAGVPLFEAQAQAMKRDKKGALKWGLTWTERVTYAGTGWKFIPFEDGFIFPLTCREQKDARGVGERMTISGMELKRGAKKGLFIQAEVDALMNHQSDATPQERKDRLEHAGVEIDDTEGPFAEDAALYREYDCARMSLRLDGDDDGEEEILIVTLHLDTSRILDIRYSQYEHGEHIYDLFHFHKRAGELIGGGEAETIATLQDAETARLCMEANHADLTINASTSLITDDMAGIDPDTFEFTMGSMIRVRDIRGVKEWPFQPLPAEFYTMGERYKTMVDRVTGVTNISLGRETEGQKTLGEVEMAMGQSNMLSDDDGEGVARQWAWVWEKMRSIEAQFGEGGQVRYRRSGVGRDAAMAGEPMFGSIPSERLLAKVKLVPAGLRQISDMRSKMSQAMAMNTVFANNPLTANLMSVWKIALQATMEAGKYPPREQVMQAVEEELMRQQQQMMLQEQMAMAMAAQGVPPGSSDEVNAQGEAPPAPEMGVPPPAVPPIGSDAGMMG